MRNLASHQKTDPIYHIPPSSKALNLEVLMKALLCLSILFSAVLATFGVSYAEPAMPDSIVRVGACATPGVAWGVFVQGDYAYIADRSAVTIVDVSAPDAPWMVSSLNNLNTWALGVFVKDTVAHLNYTSLAGRCSAVSVADPGLPYLLNWCSVSLANYDVGGIVILDTLSYVAVAEDGMYIINIADPSSLTVIQSYDTPGNVFELAIVDSLLYVADYDSLQVLNVAVPASPSRIGASGMPASCYAVSHNGDYVYVVCQSSSGFDGSLQVISVSDPSSPQIVASVDNIGGDPLDVWASGNFAYVVAADYWSLGDGEGRQVGGLRPQRACGLMADVEGGVRVIDISDPLSPSLVASYDTPGDPRGVFAVGDLIFVADYDSLQILQHVIVGVEEKSVVSSQQPAIRLGQNRPNPFHASTVISYSLPVANSVALAVHDLAGRLVETIVDEEQGPGVYRVQWNAKDKASGIYFCRLQAGDFMDIKKMILLR